MPRGAREKSESGVYHTMLRGINRQRIFENDRDCERFVEILGEYKQICGYELYAYCLMGNHVHILLKEGAEPLERVFRRIASKYVYWFNVRYDRVGHLFQDRYKSEPVDDDAYFLTVLRYILRNPVEAGLCSRPEQYRFSSCADYMGRAGVTDTAFALSLLPGEGFGEFVSAPTGERCLDIGEKPSHRLTDDDARLIIEEISGCPSVTAFQALPQGQRDTYLAEILLRGISIRQASRLTGISPGVVRRFTPGKLSAGKTANT